MCLSSAAPSPRNQPRRQADGAIVFTAVGDPVAAGPRAWPSDGNATGLSNIIADWAETTRPLKQAAPERSALPCSQPTQFEPALRQREAARVAIELPIGGAAGDLDWAFSAQPRSDRTRSSRPIPDRRVAATRLAIANRPPAIYSQGEFAQEGGLLACSRISSTTARRAPFTRS